jgi:hypothetical protein
MSTSENILSAGITNKHVQYRHQLVDWSAAVWAGLIAGSIFLLLNLFLMHFHYGSGIWTTLRFIASLVLGKSVLAPPASFDAGILMAALLTHYFLSVGFTLILAVIIHRWGLLTGIILGGLFGFALYCINFYTMTLWFPWFFAINSSSMLISHIVFGMFAGAIYEALEVEEFVYIDESAA